MSAVNETVVREYFEALGFMVSQPGKYVAPGKRNRVEEGLDLLVVHPGVREHKIPTHQEWTSRDLLGIARAVVVVRGWHSERFSESTFRNSPDILGLVEPEVRRFAARALGSASFAQILCLPGLPSTGDLRAKTLGHLREKGIDGVLSFRTILLELIQIVDENRNYEKSDLLQTIRILKRYELIKDLQMEFFENKQRRMPGSTPRRTAVPDRVEKT